MKTTPAASALRARPFVVVAMAIAVAALFNALIVGCGGGGSQSTEGTQSTTETTQGGGETSGSTEATDGAMAAAPDGAKIYAERCALCHGPNGKGDGPASAGLDPKPRNHTDGAYMNKLTSEEISNVIHNGKGAMPAWKEVLTDEEIAAVIKHVRSLAVPPYQGD